MQTKCEELGISKQTYYRSIKNVSKDDKDASYIFKVFNDSMCTYGYRRIKQAVFEEFGIIMNAKKIQRIMKEYYIRPEYAKRRKQTAQKKVLKKNVKNKIY